ncbi:PQQ-dependent sugar dehydrogenase [Haloarchaeobius salinus]|uniref:PQQ-dependent sugar dehydrogenase n=1 Tax=Haloarchaeobius salinus TaxID=1198298 RepID=UPI00210BBA52|nr:PQQ-dependent sugar dehydrogenase [Haloarchaeobius salinus]
MSNQNDAGDASKHTPAPDESTDGSGSSDGIDAPSRRRILAGIGTAGVAFGAAPFLTSGQQEEIRLGGEVEAWQGRAPESISGQANPTLSLQAGQQYELTWENLDGLPHNVLIRDSDGNQLVRSELISQQGETQTVTFTASSEMSRYLCEVHPNTMVGDVSVSGQAGTTTGTETETTTDQGDGQRPGFFQPGTRVSVEPIAEGMTAPTDYAVPDDGSDRQFVTDQAGEVWVVTSDGRQETPFLDVSDRIVELGEFAGSYADPTQAYEERGLLGIDFHPDVANNGLFYLHYSAPPNDDTPDGWSHVEVVSEFSMSDDMESADPDSERTLLEIQKPQYNHDAGPMAFGPDGYLYVPMGDGGGADDDMDGHVEDWYDRNAGGNGQDITENLLGSVLRIDVDTEGEDRPYGIPDDNPFVDTDALPEIYAYGLRNPFGISFDSQGNQFVADAGQNLFEEANIIEAGGNYGWNVKEGTHCFSTESPGDPAAITDCPSNAPDEAPHDGRPLIDPVVEFPHTYQGESVGITIIGGHRYEAGDVPELQGKYVFGAWTSDPARNQPDGRIFAATPPSDFGGLGETDGETTTATETSTAAGTTDTTTTSGTTATTGTPTDGDPGAVPTDRLWEMEELVVTGGFDYFVRMFGQGPNGEVYVLVNRQGVPEGDTGAVLQLLPAEEEPNGTTQAPGEGTGTGTGTGTDSGTGTGDETQTAGGTGTQPGDTTGPGGTGTAGGGAGGQPGFDLITAGIATVGSAALLLYRRTRPDDEDD